MLNSNTQLNYLLGTSFILGLEQRLVINTGCSFGQVKRLSDTFNEGDVISEQITTLPTKDQWSSGWYFGVSYNF